MRESQELYFDLRMRLSINSIFLGVLKSNLSKKEYIKQVLFFTLFSTDNETQYQKPRGGYSTKKETHTK